MQNIVKPNPSAYGKSPEGLSKEWWRCFIHQCSATGHITRLVKPATFGAATSIQGAYAQLEPTTKGRNTVSSGESVLFPQLNVSVEQTVGKANNAQIKWIGKGKHPLPILKNLLCGTENWLPLDTKEIYQYPGWHSSSAGNVLYYTDNVKSLPQYSEPHFMWSDIQMSKTSTTKNKFKLQINSKEENLQYCLSHCNGVKKCAECDHVFPKSYVKNNCNQHPLADLISTEGCAVEFVYIFPQNVEDQRRWIGGLTRSVEVTPMQNLHNHPIGYTLNHKLPAKVISDITKTLEDNPYLTTRQIQCGQGLGYRPGSVDIVGSSYV